MVEKVKKKKKTHNFSISKNVDKYNSKYSQQI